MISYAKNKITYSVLILSSLAVTLFYQNCAKLDITDTQAESRALETERIALGKDEELVVVGVNAVPDLKMFFVVDNSGTMKQNQFNLSQSFGAMFDAGSSESLSKFDTTAVLISTAQKSPSFTSEKASLDDIAAEQKNYVNGMTTTSNFFAASIRSALFNFGFLPGDNVGYQLTSSLNPLKYTFMPAPVLGSATSGSQVSFKSVIRKLASESPAVLETEFKNRLAVLNSERIPLVLTGNEYKPEHANVVDTESGLCAIARILRNPESTIKSGDLLSFTVVSDENDNDPKGLNCIQSVTQFTGNEDLVDGACAQRESSLFYTKTSSTKAPDSCKLNGNQTYNYKLTYPGTKVTTTIDYKAVAAAAVYNAPYSSITYKAQTSSYQYLNTTVSYYVNTCVNIVSDGLVVGQKCTIGATPVKATKAGNFVSASDCNAYAKASNANAVLTAPNAPVCTTAYVASGACLASDANCKISVATADKTVSNIVGSLDSAACLAQAKSYSDYSSSGVPVCTATPKSVATCSSAEAAAGCTLKSDATYAVKSVTISGDYTTTSVACFNYAKTISGNAVTVAGDVTKCLKTTVAQDQTYSSSIAFSATSAADNGTSVGVNADCGVVKSLIVSKAQTANAAIPSSASCVIVSYGKASETSEALASNCTTQANNRCSTQSLRDCVGTLVVGATTPATTTPVVYKKVQEDIRCTSKCSDSKLGACEADQSNITVAQYVKNKFGSTAVCTETVSDIASSKVVKLAQLASTAANICQPTLAGIPNYFTQTKGPYRTSSLEVDYVAGTVKDANGNSAPEKGLVDYIQSRAQALSNGNAIFSALVRRSTDTLGQGGSYGVDYESLITKTKGQIGSVLSNDYSVALKSLGSVIKSNIERTLILKKMKATQVIKKVYRVAADSSLEEIQSTLWTQNGSNLVFTSALDLNDGDQFKVEYQNY